MITYVLLEKSETGNGQELGEFKNKKSLIKEIKNRKGQALDVMVFEGDQDDQRAYYRKTLDPVTLTDKGY